MEEENNDKQILLDADVVRHFYKGGLILQLPNICKGKLAILDIVKNEICRSKHLEQPISNFLSFSKIPILPFPAGGEILKEYTRLRREGLGEGESACMAYARFNSKTIASSNLKDIKSYCAEHKIQYLTTMDILVIGLENKILTVDECNQFIAEVKAKNSKLPTNTIEEYIQKYK